jgi:ribosome recycling factor
VSLKHDLKKVRTGRAHTSLLDHIRVDYYGTDSPLNQVANVSVVDARTLSVTPWEKQHGRGHREGHPQLRPAPQPRHGRRHDPRADAAAHRGASQGHPEGGEATRPRTRASAVRNVRRDANWPT